MVDPVLDAHEYTLTTAYDLFTASYDGAGESYSFSPGLVPTQRARFNTNGSKMLILDDVSRDIVEYNLGTNFDVSTAVHAGTGEEFNVSAQESTVVGMDFSPDGLILFITGFNDDHVVRYDLSAAFDVSTAVYAGAAAEFDISPQLGVHRSFIFSPVGDRFFIGSQTSQIYEYNISSVPATDFTESFPANDGTLTAGGKLPITLSGNTFNDPDTDGVLTSCGGAVSCSGQQVEITNLPAGLTPTVNLFDTDGTTPNTRDNSTTYFDPKRYGNQSSKR